MKALQSENNSWLSDFNRIKKENDQLKKINQELGRAIKSASIRQQPLKSVN